MARYLVALDYSDNSADALRYAHQLAEHADAELEVAHVLLPSRQAEYPADTTVLKRYLRKEHDRLAQFQEETIGSVYPQHILKGFVTEALLAHGQLYDLIIAGSRGKHTLLSSIMGSTAVALAQSAGRPVEIIPEGAEYRELEHILLGLDDSPFDPRTGDKLAAFNRHFGARVHIVHVSPDAESGQGHESFKETLTTYLEENHPDLDYDLEFVDGESAASTLLSYADAHPIDLMLLVNQTRGFWNNLFHRGTTAQLVLESQIPVMVFHR